MKYVCLILYYFYCSIKLKEIPIMKTRKFEVIVCPKCGREYLPAELYVPNEFFGRPKDIVRDVYGTILDYEGTSVDLQETYICDKCNTNFVVRAKIGFMTEVTKLDNFDEEYITPIHKNTLFLDEN